MTRISDVFPVGGPVPPELVVGRTEQITTLTARLREGQGVTLVGPRRIGKTTVCDAVCAQLQDTHVIVRVEVPESHDASLLWARVAAECRKASVLDEAKTAFNWARPGILTFFKSQGLDLDIPKLDVDPASMSSRGALSLPLAVAQERGLPVVFFLDELQRVVTYADGEAVTADLVDLYGTRAPNAALLIDGSDERTINELLGDPHYLSKIAPREHLPNRIPTTEWRDPIVDRFRRLGLSIERPEVDRLLDWSQGHPYSTVAAAAEAAFQAKKGGSPTVTWIDIDAAINAATQRLRDDA